LPPGHRFFAADAVETAHLIGQEEIEEFPAKFLDCFFVFGQSPTASAPGTEQRVLQLQQPVLQLQLAEGKKDRSPFFSRGRTDDGDGIAAGCIVGAHVDLKVQVSQVVGHGRQSRWGR
jgi:hypothetical protein